MKLKRTVSVILAFLMIMGMIPLSVLAAGEDYEQIRLDETKSANILNAGDKAIFKFIPDEKGYYSFFSSGDDDTYGYIYNENMEQLAYNIYGGEGSNNFKVTYEMTAGTVYLLAARYYGKDKTGSFDVSVSKTALATEISIVGSLKGYIGTSDYLSVSATPENSFYGEITWSSSNEDIATVDQSGQITYKAVGTATVTAKSKTDLIATCEVTVSEPGTLYENTPCRVEINEINEKKAFYFTPSEDGRYTFYCDNYLYSDTYIGGASIMLCNSENNYSIASASSCLTYTLQKEKTYLIYTSYPYESTASYDLIAIKAVSPAAVMLLDKSTVELYPNTNTYNSLSIKFDPWYADCGNVTWTSGDDSVVSIKHHFTSSSGQQLYYGCSFEPKSIGKTTVTAAAERGKSAQYTVVVKDYENISLGETKAAVIDSEYERILFRFIPDEDGYYSFSSEAGSYTHGEILDENLNELAASDWDSNFKVNCKMTAGTTYILEARYNDGRNIGSFNVTVSKADLANGISIKNRLNGYVGASEYLYVSATPEGSAYGKIKWSSSNETVAAVDQSGRVTYKAVGTATVTAKSETDLIATCEVTVSEPETMYENTPCRVEINENNEEKAFAFTPSEEGKYTFYCYNYSYNSGSAFIRLFNSVNDIIASDSYCLTYTLEKGKTYTINTNFSYISENTRSYDLVVVKAAPPTAIELLDKSVIETYINTEGGLSIKFDKWYADYGNLKWTSDNESVLSITSYYTFNSAEQQKCHGCNFKTNSVGTATVTAATRSGLTAKYTVVVKDYENISAGETKSAVIGYGGARSYFRFTPKETGYYSFYSDNNAYAYGKISDENLNELASDNNGSWKNSFKVKYEMKAGTAYILETGYSDSSKTGSFNITVEKAKAVTKLEITALPYRMDYVKGFVTSHIEYDGLTLKATWSDGRTATKECYGSYLEFDDEIVRFDFSSTDEDGIVKISCGSAATQLKFRLKENPVVGLEVASVSEHRYIENCDGYMASYYNYETEKSEYFYRYHFYSSDVSDAVIQINYTNGTFKTARIGDYVDGFRIDVSDDQYNNHWKRGSDNYVTVSYMGKETKLPITVIANPVDHIEVISAPSRVYYYGDEAFGDYYPEDNSYHFYPTDLTGLTVKVYYTNNTSKIFTLKNGERYGELDGYSYSISFDGEGNGWHSAEIGDFPVTFNYMGHSADYNVTIVESPVESISVTKKPSKTVYNSAFAPIFDGMEITIKYKNGQSKTVTLTAENTSRRFTYVDENTRYDYIYIDGHPLIIKQENYYGIGNEFSVSYLGAKTELKNIFSYETDEITDVAVTNFNRYTLELSLTVKYKSGKTETLKITGNQINGDYDNYWYIMCYAVTPNGILYFDIQADGNYKADACDIIIFGKNIRVPAKQNIYDINCDGKADAQDLVLLRTALLNSADAEEYPELDINGDGVINILDLIRLKKYISGLIKVGDVNADGKIDAQDLVLLRIALMNSATADQNYALDNNGDGIVNILDLIHLKKHIATGAPLGGSGKTASST